MAATPSQVSNNKLILTFPQNYFSQLNNIARREDGIFIFKFSLILIKIYTVSSFKISLQHNGSLLEAATETKTEIKGNKPPRKIIFKLETLKKNCHVCNTVAGKPTLASLQLMCSRLHQNYVCVKCS